MGRGKVCWKKGNGKGDVPVSSLYVVDQGSDISWKELLGMLVRAGLDFQERGERAGVGERGRGEERIGAAAYVANFTDRHTGVENQVAACRPHAMVFNASPNGE